MKKKPKLLIADDEPNILVLASMVFSEIGYEVIEAENGQKAIDLAKTEKPDVIISDVLMPGKSGYDLCRAVRAIREISNTPIILLSAMGNDEIKLTGLNEGADDYITKPFNIEELKARVRNLLSRARGDLIEPSAATTQPFIFKELETQSIEQLPSGIAALDALIYGGLPVGSNLLIVGPTGIGKSTLARSFIHAGLKRHSPSLYITLDDPPTQIRKQLKCLLENEKTELTNTHFPLEIVDAFSWASTHNASEENFVLKGGLELNKLRNLIESAADTVGNCQGVTHESRRVIDSISSLFVYFSDADVHTFLTNLARTGTAMGATTLFLLEEDAHSAETLSRLSYIMDGVVEFGTLHQKNAIRIKSMKWVDYNKSWLLLE